MYWFAPAPEGRLHAQDFFFRTVIGAEGPWAVHTWDVAEDQFANRDDFAGGFLVVLEGLREQLEVAGCPLPGSLLPLTSKRSLAAAEALRVSGAEPVLVVVDELPSLALSWVFGPLRAFVTVAAGVWVGALCPATHGGSPALVTTTWPGINQPWYPKPMPGPGEPYGPPHERVD